MNTFDSAFADIFVAQKQFADKPVVRELPPSKPMVMPQQQTATQNKERKTA